jgi:hypothetical protein
MSPLVRSEHRGAPDRRIVQTQTMRRLNARIAIVTAIVMAELWALTAALEAWSAGHVTTLPWLLGFQLVAFSGALATWMATPRHRAVPLRVAPARTPQPATAD